MIVTPDTTVAEVEEAITHMCAAAQCARNPKIYDVLHRRINDHLTTRDQLLNTH